MAGRSAEAFGILNVLPRNEHTLILGRLCPCWLVLSVFEFLERD